MAAAMAELPNDGRAWLLQRLEATMSADQATRRTAEQALAAASEQQGYGVVLTRMVTQQGVDVHIRQISFRLLYVKEHWQEGDEHYRPPSVSAEDKAIMKALLPAALEVRERRLQTAIGMAIIAIAQFDWPQEWPELMPILVESIADPSNQLRVHGALQCLAMLSDDIDDTQLPLLVPKLFPVLYSILTSDQVYPSSVCQRALYVLRNCIAMLGVMSGHYQEEIRYLMTPMLPQLIKYFCSILTPPLPSDSPTEWAMRMQVIKCLLQIVQNFPRLSAEHLPGILGSLWQTFTSGSSVYERGAVAGLEDSHGNLDDMDGSEQGLEVLMIQVFEFLLSVTSHPQYVKLVEQGLSELVKYTFVYLQMTEEQIIEWSNDPNQYVADEDNEAYSCRVSGCLLLEELVENHVSVIVKHIIAAAFQRFQEARALSHSGHKDWWKIREAGMLGLGTIAEALVEEKDFEVTTLVDDVLSDLSLGKQMYPFLQARAFGLSAKLVDRIDKSRATLILEAASAHLMSQGSTLTKVGACRAITKVLDKFDAASLGSPLKTLYYSLGPLLTQLSEDALHLALEALTAIIRAAFQMEGAVVPVVLEIWAQYVNDPLISIDALEVLEAVAAVPSCLEPILHRVLPSLQNILSKPEQQSSSSLAGACSLLTMLLKKLQLHHVCAIQPAVFHPLTLLLLHSEDHAVLQDGAECLAMLVRQGGPALLDSNETCHQVMSTLLEVAVRLLDPGLDSSASLFAGDLVNQLVMRLPHQLAPHLPALVRAVVGRLATSQMPSLTTSLLLVFSRLVHMSAPAIGEFVTLLAAISMEGQTSALSFVMSTWTQFQGDIQGAYQIKVSTTALALLLAPGDPRLASVQVQGRLLESPMAGILTRSRAKLAPVQWSTVALPSKILSLLLATLLEMSEQGGPDDNEQDDDEWEEVGEGNDDSVESDPAEVAVASNNESLHEYTSGAYQAWQNDEPLQVDTLDLDADDVDAAHDPINQIDLVEWLRELLRTLARHSPPALEALCQDLTPLEKKVLLATVGDR
eukprot:SM000308S11831  [mRNA]  locus=s308:17944:27143:- [translate_table: standard]